MAVAVVVAPRPGGRRCIILRTCRDKNSKRDGSQACRSVHKTPIRSIRGNPDFLAWIDPQVCCNHLGSCQIEESGNDCGRTVSDNNSKGNLLFIFNVWKALSHCGHIHIIYGNYLQMHEVPLVLALMHQDTNILVRAAKQCPSPT